MSQNIFFLIMKIHSTISEFRQISEVTERKLGFRYIFGGHKGFHDHKMVENTVPA